MSNDPVVIDKRPSYDQSPAEKKPFTAKPLGDYIVVKRIAEPEGLIVEADIAKDKPINCEVVAVSNMVGGVGPGDKVLIRSYSGTEVKVDGEEYTLILIHDVLLKL